MIEINTTHRILGATPGNRAATRAVTVMAATVGGAPVAEVSSTQYYRGEIVSDMAVVAKQAAIRAVVAELARRGLVPPDTPGDGGGTVKESTPA